MASIKTGEYLVEGESHEILAVILGDQLKEKLRSIAFREKRTMGSIIRELLLEYIRKEAGKNVE